VSTDFSDNLPGRRFSKEQRENIKAARECKRILAPRKNTFLNGIFFASAKVTLLSFR